VKEEEEEIARKLASKCVYDYVGVANDFAFE
jgi:hypothetical protein